jgi:hypothetical protein
MDIKLVFQPKLHERSLFVPRLGARLFSTETVARRFRTRFPYSTKSHRPGQDSPHSNFCPSSIIISETEWSHYCLHGYEFFPRMLAGKVKCTSLELDVHPLGMARCDVWMGRAWQSRASRSHLRSLLCSKCMIIWCSNGVSSSSSGDLNPCLSPA